MQVKEAQHVEIQNTVQNQAGGRSGLPGGGVSAGGVSAIFMELVHKARIGSGEGVTMMAEAVSKITDRAQTGKPEESRADERRAEASEAERQDDEQAFAAERGDSQPETRAKNQGEARTDGHSDQQTRADNNQQAHGDNNQQAHGDNNQQARADNSPQARGDNSQQARTDNTWKAHADNNWQVRGNDSQRAGGGNIETQAAAERSALSSQSQRQDGAFGLFQAQKRSLRSDMQANAGVAAQIKVAEAVDQAGAAQQQAAQLSKMVGGGANKIQVQTTVTEEAATLVSRPGASLVGAMASVDESIASAKSPMIQGRDGGMVQSVAMMSQQNTQPAAAVQAQGQQAAAQTILAGGAGDIKRPLQIGLQGQNSGPQAQAASGESLTASTHTGAPTQARQSAQTQAAHQPRFSLPGQGAVDQVSVQIVKALHNGGDKISIALKPAELGRVDVKIELTHDGRLSAVVSTDKQETLDLLRRDAGDLQKALQDAGFDVSSGDLGFNLRKQGEQSSGSQIAGDGGKNTEESDDDLSDLDRLLAGDHIQDIIEKERVDVRA